MVRQMNLRKATLLVVNSHVVHRAVDRVPTLDDESSYDEVIAEIASLIRHSEPWGNQKGAQQAFWEPETDLVFIVEGFGPKTFSIRTVLTMDQAIANVAMRTSK